MKIRSLLNPLDSMIANRPQVDRYAKYSTEHLALAASRIENGRGGNVIELARFCHIKTKAA